jgi:hypothetical protein
MKMEQIECSETSAFILQPLGNYPKESIQHIEHSESLKSRTILLSTNRYHCCYCYCYYYYYYCCCCYYYYYYYYYYYSNRYSDSLRAGRPGDGIPVGDEIFPACPDRPWGAPNLLYSGYQLFPGGKAAAAWL